MGKECVWESDFNNVLAIKKRALPLDRNISTKRNSFVILVYNILPPPPLLQPFKDIEVP